MNISPVRYDRHMRMIKTRKDVILLTFSFIIVVALISNFMSLFCQDTQITQQFDVELPKPEEHASTQSRKKRMRKSKNSDTKKQKKASTYLDFDYEQLIAAKNRQKENNNISATIKYLEQLLKLTTDVTQIAEHLLELADAFYLDGQFKKSAHIYTQYCNLYPGSIKQEYALYRSIMSSFALILPMDRDQTKTEETLGLTEVFLLQDQFVTHKEEVLQVQQQCYTQLAASECNVCTFYLNNGKLKAAEKRLTKLRSYWLPKLPTLEPEIIALEVQLTEKKEMIELLNNKNTQVAQNKKLRHMAHRF